MKTLHNISRAMTADWKTAILISLPIFVVAMWFGISRGYDQIGLFAVAMALSAWSIGDMAASLVKRLREHRLKNRGAHNAQASSPPRRR
jgi:hypothetical protein